MKPAPVAEAADGRGQAGPSFAAMESALLRDWLCTQLLPLSEQNGRRWRCARVAASLANELTGDEARDAARIDLAVEEQVLAVGAPASAARSRIWRAAVW